MTKMVMWRYVTQKVLFLRHVFWVQVTYCCLAESRSGNGRAGWLYGSPEIQKPRRGSGSHAGNWLCTNSYLSTLGTSPGAKPLDILHIRLTFPTLRMTFSVNTNSKTSTFSLLNSYLLNSPRQKACRKILKFLGALSHLKITWESVISAHRVHLAFFHLVKGRSLFTSLIGYRTKPITDSSKAKCPPQENLLLGWWLFFFYSNLPQRLRRRQQESKQKKKWSATSGYLLRDMTQKKDDYCFLWKPRKRSPSSFIGLFQGMASRMNCFFANWSQSCEKASLGHLPQWWSGIWRETFCW